MPCNETELRKSVPSLGARNHCRRNDVLTQHVVDGPHFSTK